MPARRRPTTRPRRGTTTILRRHDEGQERNLPGRRSEPSLTIHQGIAPDRTGSPRIGPLQPRLSLMQGRSPCALPNRQQPPVHQLPSVPTHSTTLHGLHGRIHPGKPHRPNRSCGNTLHQRRLSAQGARVSQLPTRGAHAPVKRQNQQPVLGVQRVARRQRVHLHRRRRQLSRPVHR